MGRCSHLTMLGLGTTQTPKRAWVSVAGWTGWRKLNLQCEPRLKLELLKLSCLIAFQRLQVVSGAGDHLAVSVPSCLSNNLCQTSAVLWELRTKTMLCAVSQMAKLTGLVTSYCTLALVSCSSCILSSSCMLEIVSDDAAQALIRVSFCSSASRAARAHQAEHNEDCKLLLGTV